MTGLACCLAFVPKALAPAQSDRQIDGTAELDFSACSLPSASPLRLTGTTDGTFWLPTALSAKWPSGCTFPRLQPCGSQLFLIPAVPDAPGEEVCVGNLWVMH